MSEDYYAIEEQWVPAIYKWLKNVAKQENFSIISSENDLNYYIEYNKRFHITVRMECCPFKDFDDVVCPLNGYGDVDLKEGIFEMEISTSGDFDIFNIFAILSAKIDVSKLKIGKHTIRKG